MLNHFFGHIGPETVAIAIPIFSVIGGVAIAITAIIMGGKKKELEHRERLQAIEKGVPLPEEPRKEKRPVYSARRAGGLVMFGIGAALTIGMWVAGGAIAGVWGFVPLFIGIGLLIAARLDKQEYEAAVRDEKQERSQGSSFSG